MILLRIQIRDVRALYHIGGDRPTGRRITLLTCSAGLKTSHIVFARCGHSYLKDRNNGRGNKKGGATSPLLAKKGGCAIKKISRSQQRFAQTEWLSQSKVF